MEGRQTEFNDLPQEIRQHIYALIPNVKEWTKIREINEESKDLIDNALMSNAEKVFHLITHLPLSHVMQFIRYYRNTPAFRALDKHYKSGEPIHNSYAELCYALATDDVQTINRDKLDKAVQTVAETTKNDEQVQACLIGLRIVATALKSASERMDDGIEAKLKAPFFMNLAKLGPSSDDSLHKRLLHIEVLYKYMEGANLEGNCLGTLILRTANFEGANLRNTNLANTHLMNVDLQDADMRNANLQNVKFDDVKLRDANLQQADLQGAVMLNVGLKNICLQGVKHPESAFITAVLNNQFDMASALLKSGVIKINDPCLLNRTALQVVVRNIYRLDCSRNQIDQVIFLLNNRASPLLANAEDKLTPLHVLDSYMLALSQHNRQRLLEALENAKERKPLPSKPLAHLSSSAFFSVKMNDDEPCDSLSKVDLLSPTSRKTF